MSCFPHPIFATGIWRKEDSNGIWRKAPCCEELEAFKDFKVTILSPEDEAKFESMSVLRMLQEKGVGVNQCILTVGTGNGSCQFVLYDDEKAVAQRLIKNGYATEPGHESKLETMAKLWESHPDGKKPDLIVAWGAVWYSRADLLMFELFLKLKRK